MNPQPLIQPWDTHNQSLISQVHPEDWINPKPASRYNLVILGGGTAGLVTAAVAAGLGARVALIEKHLLGGDCLNTGCVPSKALLHAARAVVEVRAASRFGVDVDGAITVDFARVMERMRRLRAEMSSHDSARRFTELGVDVFIGHGRFVGTDKVAVGDSILRFSKAVIATGAKAVVPSIPGLKDLPYLTHETLFELTELPKQLGIIGAGPIGCEMAQCFARFGSQVVLVEGAQGLLPREDREAVAIVRSAMEQDGVRFLQSNRQLECRRQPGGITLITPSNPDNTHALNVEAPVVDRLLVATGRLPNVKGLGLETVGVALDGSQGIRVDDRLRTTHPNIYACGDVCSQYQFTHAADFMARAVVQNALFMGRIKARSLIIPWCTYTSPELAHVGMNGTQAREMGFEVETFTQEMNRVDRALLDGETKGFVRVHVRKGTDRIVGATAVGANAGELIGEITLAMKGRLGLKTVGNAIHPYPTRGEAVRKLGDLYNRTRLNPFVKKLLSVWLAWQR
jgi:pyruvate/2-oxoglutarate dehydrogenase complex dihydrolipoamide dehydrogenase (E3) component